MSSAEEEQVLELEALESIYPSELQVVSGSAPREYQLQVSAAGSDTGKDAADDPAAMYCTLMIRLPADYPSTRCEMTVHGGAALTNEWVARLQKVVDDTCAEAADSGSVAIFVVTSAVQEWLADHKDAIARKQSTAQAHTHAATEQAADSAANAIKKPSPLGIEPGTLVNLESFTAWKRLYDAERAGLKPVKSSGTGKLTGKQLFQQNKVHEVDEEEASKMEEENLSAQHQQPHIFDADLFDEEDEDFLPSEEEDEEG